MDKYNVICIDDEPEKLGDFIDVCKDIYGISLHTFRTQKAGLDEYEKNQSFYDALILDVQVLDESENEKPDEKSMWKARDRIRDEFKDLPYFICTGQQEVQKHSRVIERLYWKGRDDDELCEDIVNAIKERPNIKVRNAYPELFENLDKKFYDSVLDIMKTLGENAIRSNNTDIFNKIRQVLDMIMPELYEKGICKEKFNGTNLNDCSKSIDGNNYVPTYIRRNIHSLVVISNNGSHHGTGVADDNNLVVVNDVKSGKAPYLVASTIFELANVLIWMKQLPDTLPYTFSHSEMDDYEGKVMALEQDENGNYHCAKCILPHNVGLKTKVGDKIFLNNVAINEKPKTKDKYPFFAKFKNINQSNS